MLVETYEVEEVKTEIGNLAADSEAAELINKLGLEGQSSLLNKETVTRFPYRKMTKEEGFVYSVLCPKKTELAKYSEASIPLRVLQVAAHAKDTAFLDEMVVLYPENADIKDPVLVGYKKVGYETHQYILARWGTELEPLSKLLPIALEKRKGQLRAKLCQFKAKIEAELASIETEDYETLLSEPHFYR